MKLSPELAHLFAGLVLALAGAILAGIHVPVPDYIPYAAVALFGVSGGMSLPKSPGVTPSP